MFNINDSMDINKSLSLLDDSMLISKRGLNRIKLPRQSVLQDSYLDISSTISDGNVSHFAKNKTNQLYYSFLETLQKRPSSVDVFPTIEELIESCDSILKEIDDLERKTENRHNSTDEYWTLEREKNTWKLLYCLYKDRCIDQKDEMDIDNMVILMTEKQIIDQLYSSKEFFFVFNMKTKTITFIS